MISILLDIDVYKLLTKISLILFLGLRFSYCAGNECVPFEDGELLERSSGVVRLAVSENIPAIRKGPPLYEFLY